MRGMGRRLRFLAPGGLVEVTSRTIHGRLLIQPTPRIADLCHGVLARAARLYPVDVHAFAFLGNHYHLLLTVPDAQRLAQFMNYLNSNLAREVGRAARWREHFWGRRYQAIPVSEEETSQVERLLYVLRQGCKEGLVRRPAEWPGATSVRALLSGEPIRGSWIDRTSEYLSSKKGDPHDPRSFVSSETLDLVPLPCWKDLAPADYRNRVADLVAEVERETARQIRATEREPLGADRVSRQNPHDAPNRRKQGPAPLVHAATSERRKAFREAYRQFASAFRRASTVFRCSGDGLERFALFPPGSFPPPGPFLASA